MTNTSKYLSTEEACELLRCSPDTLRRWARNNNWDRIRPSQRHVLYRREQIEKHLEKHTYRIY